MSNLRVFGLIGVLIAGTAAGYAIRNWQAGNDLRQARAATASHARLDQAAKLYHRHLHRFPTDNRIRLELAYLLKNRNPDAALRELRAIPLDAAEALPAARQIAAIALELGRDYDAIGPLNFLQGKLPQDSTIQLALAEIRFREHDYEAAIQHASRRRELAPLEVDSYLLIAESLDELKRPAEMIEPLKEALQVDAELAQAHLNLSYALQRIDQNDEALEHVEWFLKRHPETAAAHRIHSLILRGLGRHAEALTAVQQALRIQPHNLESALLEVELLLYFRRADEAFERMTALASRFGDERRILVLQLQSASLSGRADVARKLQARLKRLGVE